MRNKIILSLMLGIFLLAFFLISARADVISVNPSGSDELALSGGAVLMEGFYSGVDMTAPVITLILPEDGTSTTTAFQTFKYNVTDFSNIANCSLIINGVVDQNSSNITKNTAQEFSKTLSVGSYIWGINCTDTMGNIGSSSSRTLTISGGGGAGGGAGGGGGGGGAEIRNFSVSPEEIHLDVLQKELKKFSVKVSNTGQTDLDFSVSSSLDFIIIPGDFSLRSRGERELEFYAYAPEKKGVYFGEIIIRASGVTKRIPINVNVSAAALFDINAKVLPKYKSVFAGKNVTAEIKMINMGKSGNVDVKLDYFVRKNGEIISISSAHETLAVETGVNVTRSLVIPEITKAGGYKFYAELSYDNTTVSSSDSFYVTTKSAIIQVVLIMAAFLIIFIFILLARRRKGKKTDKADKEILKRRILDSVKEGESLSPAVIQSRAKIGRRKLDILLDVLTNEGKLEKEMVEIGKFEYRKTGK